MANVAEDQRSVIGKRFWHLTIESFPERRTGSRYTIVMAKCDCGLIKNFRLDCILRGGTKSCGCRRGDLIAASKIEHGINCSSSEMEFRILGIYHGMIHRCYNPKNKGFKYYGARGISVCERWRNGEGGESGIRCFISDMGIPISKKYTIDRFPDNDGDYAPKNCRWATRIEQARNMRTNRILNFNGQRITLSELSSKTGIKRETLAYRLNRGMSVESSIGIPVRNYK